MGKCSGKDTEWDSRQGRNERNEEDPILPWRPLRPLRENFTEWVSRQGRNDRNEELPNALIYRPGRFNKDQKKPTGLPPSASSGATL